MEKRVVVVFGGSTLGDIPGERITHVRAVIKIIAGLTSEGHEIIIDHRNGPQVGIVNPTMDYVITNGPYTPYMSLPEYGTISQGFMDYHPQQALQQSFLKRNLGKAVVSMVAQVLVDKSDPTFEGPTKPIGNFCTYEEAVKLEEKKGFVLVKNAKRGYYRVVPSPVPQRVVELGAIRRMIRSGLLAIAVGGGGILVVEDGQGVYGIGAIIDKDKSSSKLAQELKADILIILMAVDQVYINYDQPGQRAPSELTLKEADAYIRPDQLVEGSVSPKVEARIGSVRILLGRSVIITSLKKVA